MLIAYDSSPAAHQAVVDAAKLLGSVRVIVVTVWEEGLAYATPTMPAPDLTLSPGVDPELALDVDRASHLQAERVAREGAELARSLGLDAEALAVPDERDVPRTILHVAREQRAAAIVIGSRGLSGLRARLEGSASKGVLEHASCPVIVVHERDERDD